jgi:hypothetical protein
MEYAEIAQAFGLREGTVRMRLSHALARMRAALQAPPVAASVLGAVPAPLCAGPPPAPAAAMRRRITAPGSVFEAAPAGSASAAPFRDARHALFPEPPAFSERLLRLARDAFSQR